MTENTDIVYANPSKYEQGILSEYKLDLAYGSDENSFVLSMPKNQKLILDNHYYIFSTKDANIGGVITGIGIDTASREIKYTGPTWHGILTQHIIEPRKGYDYRVYSGDANTVIKEIMQDAQFDNSFVFSFNDEESGITIYNYQVRYGNIYSVLTDMLYTYNAKLNLELIYQGTSWTVRLSAVPLVDYSADEEWSSSQRDFVANKNYKPVNHMICLGSGDLRNRHVIHLFSDGYNIMPYTNKNTVINGMLQVEVPMLIIIAAVYNNENEFPTAVEDGTWIGTFDGGVYHRYNGEWVHMTEYRLLNPTNEPSAVVKDSDYILNKMWQQYAGLMENTVVYDYPNAQTKDNYVLADSKPADWDKNYMNYYTYEDGNYKAFEGVEVEEYRSLQGKPADWESAPERYYQVVNGEYHTVDKVDTDIYTLIPSQPADWSDNYGLYYRLVNGVYQPLEGVAVSGYEQADIEIARNEWSSAYNSYYTRIWNGSYYEYNAVAGVTRYRYLKQLSQPSNWDTNYSDYYMSNGNGGYKKVAGVEKKVKKKKVTVAPAWKLNKYYTRYSFQGAPTFNYNMGDLWKPFSRTDPPQFLTNYFYNKDTVPVAPTFVVGQYYKLITTIVAPAYDTAYILYHDHYADLVANALKRFDEYLNCDKISITLKPSEQYDIGDIVGATDEVTGLSVWQPITKKIIKIEKYKKVVNYEIGRR